MARILGDVVEIEQVNPKEKCYMVVENNYYISEEMIEGIAAEDQLKQTLFDRIKSLILEAAKQAPVIVEQTEDGGIKISPIEDKNDDLPIGAPVIFSNNEDYWCVGIYKGYNNVSGKINGKTDDDKYLYIIPFDKFNPNDIKESLKHNIVK